MDTAERVAGERHGIWERENTNWEGKIGDGLGWGWWQVLVLCANPTNPLVGFAYLPDELLSSSFHENGLDPSVYLFVDLSWFILMIQIVHILELVKDINYIKRSDIVWYDFKYFSKNITSLQCKIHLTRLSQDIPKLYISRNPVNVIFDMNFFSTSSKIWAA